MSKELAQMHMRVKALWYRDGIGELAAGLVLMLLGLYFALADYFGPDSLIGGLLQPSLVLVLLALLALGRRIIDALKAWLVYPRSGYVEYYADQPSRPRWVLAAAAGGILGAGIALVATRVPALQAVPAFTGLAGAVALLVWQFKVPGVGRFMLLAAVSLGLGLVLAASRLPEGYAIALYYALMGLALLISGGLVLNHYVRHTPLGD